MPYFSGEWTPRVPVWNSKAIVSITSRWSRRRPPRPGVRPGSSGSIRAHRMELMPKTWANLTKPARTLPYDIAVMGDTRQGEPLDAAE